MGYMRSCMQQRKSYVSYIRYNTCTEEPDICFSIMGNSGKTMFIACTGSKIVPRRVNEVIETLVRGE